jgi:hypothetical protein
MSPGLRRLAERVLGFTDSTHELVRPIRSPGAAGVVGTNGVNDASRKE